MKNLNRFSAFSAGLVVLLVAMLAGCGRAPRPEVQKDARPAPLEANILARVGQQVITRDAFEAQWESRKAFASKQDLLAEMIRWEALVQAAQASGIERSPEIRSRIEKMVAAAYLEQKLEPGLKQAGEVSEADTLAYYQEHQAEFTTPEQARGGVIYLKAGLRMEADRRQALRERAIQLREAAERASAEEYRLLVQQHSEHQATRYQGGDAGWLGREASGPWDKPVMAALFALDKPGAVAPLVESETGYHIVRFLERRPPQIEALAKVAPLIRQRIARQKRQAAEADFYAQLLRGCAIQTNISALKLVPDSAAGSLPKPPNLPQK